MCNMGFSLLQLMSMLIMSNEMHVSDHNCFMGLNYYIYLIYYNHNYNYYCSYRPVLEPYPAIV